MNEGYKRSIRVLELPTVLEKLAGEAASAAAKEAARALSPMDDADEIERRLDETEGAIMLTGLFGSPSFSGLKDLSDALLRAEQGGVLSPRELLDVAGLLRAIRSVKNYAASERRPETAIDHLFAALAGNKYLEDRITGVFISEEEISDLASPELAAIRRKIRQSGDKVREVLGKIISGARYQRVLQDPIITIRQDRFVVPVKSEHRNELPGLVHDMSSSGATLFIEPMQAVELNNEIKVLKAREEQEIERILYELSAETASFSETLKEDTRLMHRLDLIFAKAKLAYKMDATRPVIASDGRLRLRRARHPMLDKKTAVPIDLALGEDFDTLVITGPNTGGKTVAIKTLGLLSLMALCGLFIPAGDRSSVPVFREILADIGDEQSIEQSLSTFSAHMKNIVAITGQAGKGSLVLFDELGAGTDPVEGAALAMAILEQVRAAGALVAATTHYAELKMFALTTPGVENASCEFDVETLRPTYRLVTGVPGKSNAFAISERLGLDPSVIARARSRVSAEDRKFEEILEELERQRVLAEHRREEAEEMKSRAEQEKKQADERLASVEQTAKEELDRASEEARRLIEETRAASEQALRELEAIRRRLASGNAEDNLGEARARLRGSMNEAEKKALEKRIHKAKGEKSRPLRAGDVVLLPGTNTRALILSGPEKDGTVRLRAGIMQVSAKAEDLILAPEEERTEKNQVRSKSAGDREMTARSAKSELDLRGCTADEAVMELDRFIDGAILAKLESVSVIHGKGTGVLRKAVHARLKETKGVKSFRLGRYGEGETGVTIVQLA